VIFFPS